MKRNANHHGAFRILSLLLCLILAVGLLPVSTLAEVKTITPGNTWHAIRFSGNYYSIGSSPNTFVSVTYESGAKGEGYDITPEKITITGADLSNYNTVSENGQTYTVALRALPKKGSTLWPSESDESYNPTYSCDIEVRNDRNYVLKVVLYDFGLQDSGNLKNFKRIRNLEIHGNVQVELRNSCIDTVNIQNIQRNGTLLIENTGSTYLCDASVTLFKGYSQAGFAFNNEKTLDGCDITIGRRGALTLNGDAAFHSLNVDHDGTEQSRITLKNSTLPNGTSFLFESPCSLSVVNSEVRGTITFDGSGQNNDYTLSLNNATLLESVTVQNKGALTLLLAGDSLLDTLDMYGDRPRNGDGEQFFRPDIMVSNDSTLTIRDDPDAANVGSLAVGHPHIDPYSGNVLYYEDARHYYSAAIGGTPSDSNPRPHGKITVESGILTATTSTDGAAIGGTPYNSAFSPDAGVLHIYGGVVNAISNGKGAAIGGAYGGNGGNFVITGGTVNARAASGAAAIGGGCWKFQQDDNYQFVIESNRPVLAGGKSGTINIQGGCVVNCKTENNYYTSDGKPKDTYIAPSPDNLYALEQSPGSVDGSGDIETQGYVLGPSARGQIEQNDENNWIKISSKNGVSPMVLLTQNISNTYSNGELDASWQNFLPIYDTYTYNPVIILIGREAGQNESGETYQIGAHVISGWRNGNEQRLGHNNYKVRGQISLPAWKDEWYSQEKFSELTLPENATLTLLSGTAMNVSSGFLVQGTEEQLVVEDGAIIQGRGIWPGKPPIDPNDEPDPEETRDLLDYLKKLEQQSGSDVGADNAGVNSTSRTIVTHLGVAKRENGNRFLIPGDSADEIRTKAAEMALTEGAIELVTIIDAGYCGFKMVGANEWSLLISNKSTVVSLVENGALSVSQCSGSNALTLHVTAGDGEVTVSATNARLCSPDYTVYESKQANAPFSVTFSPTDDTKNISDELAFSINLDSSDNKAVFSVPNFLGSSFSLDSVAPLKDKCALRYGGELSFQTPFANFAGVTIDQLQINYDGSIALGGIQGGGEVHVPDFGGFPVSGGAELYLNTFNGEQEYSLNIELETPIFEGAFEASFKEVRGVVLPDTLYAELAVGEGGIPLVPPTIVGYIQGGGLGFEGLADTINMDSFGAPPLRLKMAAKGSIVDVIDGWIRLSVGPSGFDLEMEDIEMEGVDLIDAYGISASWDAGTRMVDNREYWGMNADMNQHLDIKLGYNDKDLVTASGKIGYGGFSGYAKEGNRYHVVIQLEGYGNLEGSIQIPKNLVGPIPPFDFTVASGEIGFYTSIGAKNTINADNLNGSTAHILRELVKNTRPFFNASVGAKAVCNGGLFFPKCYAKITYVFGDKSPKISAGKGDGGELNLRELANNSAQSLKTFSTLAMVENAETGEMIPAIVEVGMAPVASLQSSGSTNEADGDDVILSRLVEAPARSENRRSSETTMYGFDADVQLGAVGNVLIAISSKNPSLTLDAGNLRVKKDGEDVALVQAIYTETDGLTNPDVANFFAGQGVAYFAPTGAGTFTVLCEDELEDVEVIKAVEFATLGSATSPTQYSVLDADANRQYKAQLFLGNDGSADYLLAEEELSGEVSYAGSFSYDLEGDLAPGGVYTPTVVLLEYVSATDENGNTVETWSPLDKKELYTPLVYTNDAMPDAPTNVKLAYSGNGTMTASWDAVTNAETYEISVYDATGKDTGAMFLVNQADENIAPETSLVMDFSSLEPGQNYSVRVKAQVNVNGQLFTSLEGLSNSTLLAAANIPALSFSDGVTLNGETGRYTFTAGAAGGSFTVTSTSPLPLDYSVVNDSTGTVVAESNGATILTVVVPAEEDAGYDGSLDNAVLRITATNNTTKDYALCYVTVNRDDTAPPLVLDNLGVFPLTRTDAGYVINVTGHSEAGADLIVWEDKFVDIRERDDDPPNWEFTEGVSANKRAETDGSFSLSLLFDTVPTSEYPTGDPTEAESYASYQNYRSILIRAKDAAGNMSDYMRVGFPEGGENTVTVNIEPNGEGANYATSSVTLAENTPISALPVAYWQDGSMIFDGWFTDPVNGTPVTTATTFTAPEPITESEEEIFEVSGEVPEGDVQSVAAVIPPVTVYAHWVPSVTLTFNVNSETASCDTAALTLKRGASPGELPVPKQTDGTQLFLGWFTAESGGALVTGETTFSADTTLYARFSEYVTVTFVSGVGSSPVSELKVPTGGTIASYPVPTSKGYIFEGWYNGEVAATAATVYSTDTALTARWTRNTNTTALLVTQAGCAEGETLPDPDITLPDLPADKWVGGTSISYVGIGTTSYLGTTKPTEPGRYKVIVQKDTFETAYVGSAEFTIAPTNTPTFTTHALLLSGEIGVKFRVSFPENFDSTGCYVDFVATDGRRSTVAYADAETTDSSTDRYFSFDINALELAETITATLHYGDDQTTEDVYSAMTYIQTVQNDAEAGEKLKNLVNALQAYGYYMQGSGWKDDKPSHKPISAPAATLTENSINSAKAAVEAFEFTKEFGESGIMDAKISLTLNAKTVINVSVKPGDGVTIASNGYKTRTIGNDTYYQFSTERIGPKNLDAPYTVMVKTNMGTATVTASALAYMNAAFSSNTLTQAQQLAMAAYYFYYNAAELY